MLQFTNAIASDFTEMNSTKLGFLGVLFVFISPLFEIPNRGGTCFQSIHYIR